MPTTRNIFDGTLSDLQRWVLPSPVWRWKLNQPVDALNRMVATLPRSEQVFGPGAPTMILRNMEFYGWRTDYVFVREIGTEEPILNVALPWLLRKTPFDGKTHGKFRFDYRGATDRWSIRTSDESDTEYQKITPKYSRGDVLRIVSAAEPLVKVGGEPLTYEAVMESHWAKAENI